LGDGVALVFNSTGMKIQFFQSASDFRGWLDKYHRKVDELWVGFYKRSSGKRSITYPESVDEALCYGWIDGVRRSVGASAYAVRFTPRKPASQWSALNIKRARALAAAGQMSAAGLRAIDAAQDQARTYSYAQRRTARLDEALERLFRANRKAWDFFVAQPPWYRRTSIFWVTSAKQEETRRRRLSALISDSQRGQWVKPLRRPGPKGEEKKR
jgi:uncharacterized protein YdeI (YjbR/CyaY-like superfamily)